MKRERPEWFLRQAVLLLVIGAAEFLAVAMALEGLRIDSVVKPIAPWDESGWILLATRVIPAAEFEAMVGATPQQVVDRFGPPLHVNRSSSLPHGCAQTYLYAEDLDGDRVGCGVCFGQSGRVTAFVGGYDPPMQFDLRWVEDDGLSPDTLFLVVPAAILAVPIAVVMRIRRTPASASDAPAGVTGRPSNKGMKLTKLSAAWLPAWTCRLMPAPARMDAGTASQLIPGVRQT